MPSSKSLRCFLNALFLCLCAAANSRAADRPNIIVIMADDMGWSDIGCYGGEIKTPNLDALAANGLRFTQFYNNARCCPTRASLLTGLYQHQAGVGHMMDDRGSPAYRGELSRNAVTMAEVLQASGYRTYMSGKWHVTKSTPPEGPKDNWPRQRGFDPFFGTIHGAGSFYDPNSLTLDNTQIAPWHGFYYTDAISDFAVRFMQEHDASHGNEPFFMYVAYTSPHWPMHAPPEDIAKYQGRYQEGWDALRAERHARQKNMGLVAEDWKLTPRDPKSPAWEDAEMKHWEERCMETYAAMIDVMDEGIGRIVDQMKETNRLDNTLIFFLADNGGCAEGYGRQDNRAAAKPDPSLRRPMSSGEIQRHMEPPFTRDGRPVRTGRGVMPGPDDTYIAYGLSWANASNTPFREYKHWVHEGGISSPLIVHWPNGLDTRQADRMAGEGPLTDTPSHLIDIMATCVDVAGAEYPERYNEHDITPFEGISLSPLFAGKKAERANPIFWEHEGNKAIRDGDWKLVAKHKGDWELYNLADDRTELHDLAGAKPEKVATLSKTWQAWADRVGVRPWPLTNNK